MQIESIDFTIRRQEWLITIPGLTLGMVTAALDLAGTRVGDGHLALTGDHLGMGMGMDTAGDHPGMVTTIGEQTRITAIGGTPTTTVAEAIIMVAETVIMSVVNRQIGHLTAEALALL